MKKGLRIGAVSLVLCTLAVSCSDDVSRREDRIPDFHPLDLPANTRSVGKSENDFAFTLLNRASHIEENYAVSPFSVYNVLLMAACADDLDGEFQKEIVQALGLGDSDIESFKDYCRLINNNLSTLDPSTVFNVANSIWGAPKLTFRPSFKSMAEHTFGAEVLNLPEGISDAKDVLNKWIYEKTNGKIKDFFQSDLGVPTISFINALYFNGKWTTPFNSSATSTDAFHSSDGDTSFASYMHDERAVTYMETDELIGIELPFGIFSFFTL